MADRDFALVLASNRHPSPRYGIGRPTVKGDTPGRGPGRAIVAGPAPCPDPGVAGGWTAPDVGRARRLIERSGTRGMKVRVWGYDVACSPEYASHFCSRRITAQIDAALATRRAEADALWRRVYGSIDRAVPAVPLLNRRTLTLVSRRVGNYAEHPLWGPLLDQIWVR